MTTIDTTAISVDLPEAFDPRWSRLPGITLHGKRITIDPAQYFFRFESHTWLVADWELVKSQLLPAEETTESAVEQMALDFVKAHGESTSDAARVLRTAYEVYAHLFRDEHLDGLGLPRFTADHLRMLRQAATPTPTTSSRRQASASRTSRRSGEPPRTSPTPRRGAAKRLNANTTRSPNASASTSRPPAAS